MWNMQIGWRIWQEMHYIRLNRVFHFSWTISTRAENSHDVLSRKPIIEELIDESGLTRPVVSENVFYLIIF